MSLLKTFVLLANMHSRIINGRRQTSSCCREAKWTHSWEEDTQKRMIVLSEHWACDTMKHPKNCMNYSLSPGTVCGLRKAKWNCILTFCHNCAPLALLKSCIIIQCHEINPIFTVHLSACIRTSVSVSILHR